jgi:hypothetical protein
MKKTKVFQGIFLALLVLLFCGTLTTKASESNLVKFDTIYFTDTSENVIFEVVENKFVYPNILITNNSFSALEAKLIVALYSADNVIQDVNVINVNQSEKTKLYKGQGFNFTQGGYVKAYLWDSFESIRALKKSILSNGVVINLPEDFPEIPFKIRKNGTRDYSHDATVYNQYDWSDATEIFISCIGSTTGTHDGTDPAQPISITLFKNRYSANIYGSQDKFIFTIVDDFYTDNVDIPITEYKINALLRSGSPSGFTWIGRIKRQDVSSEISSKWELTDGVYKTTPAGTEGVLFPVNFEKTDEFGMPRPYMEVLDLETCKTTKGSFYLDAGSVYCNPFDDDDVSKIDLHTSRRIVDCTSIDGKTVAFEKIGFLADSYGRSRGGHMFNSINKDSVFMFFDCKFYRGNHNAFSIKGYYSAFLFDCVAAYSTNDGFNYHTSAETSLAVEINGVSYNHGEYKLSGGNQSTVSNNASTSHGGMNMLRVGGRYWESEGPIVADVNDTYSISIGCEARDVLQTTTGTSSAYYLSNSTDPSPGTVNNKYVIDCLASGDIRFSLRGDVGVYSLDLETTANTTGEVNPLDWNSVLSGTWK